MIVTRLSDLRRAGVAFDLATTRGYMTGILQHQIPNIFTCLNKSGSVFRCSESFTRVFLHQHLGWSVRKATRVAQKYPPDVNTVLLNAFL